jgi:hypothetical protein
MQNILRQSFFDERCVGRHRTFVLILVAVRRNQIRAIHRATDGNFALRAAAHRANLFGFRRAIPRGFALPANRTGHNFSSEFSPRNT